MCATAPDDCAPLHLCLEDGRSVEGYTTPGFRGRTWLGEVSTGEGCTGGVGAEGASLTCMNMATRSLDEFLVTLTEAADGTLTGTGELEDGTSFDAIGNTNPAATVPVPCVTTTS